MDKGIKTPLKFNGLNFPIWKVRMTVFLQSLGSRVAKTVTKPYSAPTGDDDTWSDIAAKEYEANSNAQNALFLALNEDDTTRVIHCNKITLCTSNFLFRGITMKKFRTLHGLYDF